MKNKFGNQTFWFGVVEDRDDNLLLGRCRVRVVGVHTDNKVELPTKDLPWAYPIQPINSASISGVGVAPVGVVTGTWVIVTFSDEAMQQPMIIGTVGGIPVLQDAKADAIENLLFGDLRNEEVSKKEQIKIPEEVNTADNSLLAPVTDRDGNEVPKPSETEIEDVKNAIVDTNQKLNNSITNAGVFISKAKDSLRGFVNSNLKQFNDTIAAIDMEFLKNIDVNALDLTDIDDLAIYELWQEGMQGLQNGLSLIDVDTIREISTNIREMNATSLINAAKELLPEQSNLLYQFNSLKAKVNVDFMDSVVSAIDLIDVSNFGLDDLTKIESIYTQISNIDYDALFEMSDVISLIDTPSIPNLDVSLLSYEDGKMVKELYNKLGDLPSFDEFGKPILDSFGDFGISSDMLFKQGFIKSPITDMNLLNTSEIWTGKGGMRSLADLTNNTQIQTLIFNNEIDSSLRTFANSFISADTPKERVIGSLFTSFVSSDKEVFDMVDGISTSNLGNSLFSKGQATKTGAISKQVVDGLNFNETQMDKVIDNVTANAHPASQFDINNFPSASSSGSSTSSSEGSSTSSSEGNFNVSEVGFLDPNKEYPRQDHLQEPDTNRLARHQSIDKTKVVPTKEKERDTKPKIANTGKLWEQPLIPYNAEYPYNKVIESESGHIVEIDDTPGKERIHIYHTSGTFIEIDHNGTLTKRTKGNDVSIMENDGREHIMGSGFLTVDGHFSTHISKSMQVEILGDAQVHVHKDVNMKVGGNFNMDVDGHIKMRAGKSMNLQAGPLIAADADLVHMNSGLSAPPEPVKEFNPTLHEPTVETRQSSDDFIFEELTEKEKEYVVANKLASNNVPREEEVPQKTDETPVPEREIYNPECKGVEKPYSRFTKLSMNYRLGDVCKGDLPPEDGQHGLTQDEIICNLQKVCLNILEPLRAKYGIDLVINSGFRLAGSNRANPAASKKISQHELGQAVDISFKSANVASNKKEVMYNFAVEVKQAVAFDQFIFESLGPGSAWIHVSLDPSKLNGGRSQVLTMSRKDGKMAYKEGLLLVT